MCTAAGVSTVNCIACLLVSASSTRTFFDSVHALSTLCSLSLPLFKPVNPLYIQSIPFSLSSSLSLSFPFSIFSGRYTTLHVLYVLTPSRTSIIRQINCPAPSASLQSRFLNGETLRCNIHPLPRIRSPWVLLATTVFQNLAPKKKKGKTFLFVLLHRNVYKKKIPALDWPGSTSIKSIYHW